MKLGTHNGSFHADEVFATAFLLKLYPDAELVRSREKDVLQSCDIVYDVGHGKYDHHAREKQYRENDIPYAASGLIWRDFGRDIIRQGGIQDKASVEELFHDIDAFFIQPLDAIDNGISIEKSLPIFDIAGVVRTLNPAWDSDESQEDAFMRAVSFAQLVFNQYLNNQLAVFRAIPYVEKAFARRTIPELLILEKGCPWQQTLAELDQDKQVLYVMSPRDHGQFTIQAVPVEVGSFAVRKRFPDAWGGLEGEALMKVTGVLDAVFCHSGLWLTVANSLEGANRLAQFAIEA